jgi:hypothetical protein
MSDPIDFLMQENEENEEKNKVPDRYKEEFQDGFQDELQDEVQDEIHDGVPEGFQDENQDGTQEGFQGENHDATQDQSQDENQDEVQTGFQDENRDGTQEGFEGEDRDTTQDESQDEYKDRTQEGSQDENQDGTHDPIPDDAQEQTPADQTPVKESTDKIEPSENGGPNPLFTGDNADSSMDIDYINSGQSKQAVETIARKKEEKEMPPPLEVPKMEDPNKGENIIATAKIKVEKPKTDNNPELKFESSTSKLNNIRQPSDPTSLDIAKIKRSNGIAYLSGSNLSLAGGPKITPGDQIQIGESTYEVKLKPKNRNEQYGLIGSVVLAIFITLYFLGAFSSSQHGTLVGLVVGYDSRPISGQEVRIKETGDKFTTNSAGLFIFENLSEGIYTVEYLMDDEVIGEERITVLSNETSTVRLSRNSSRSSSDAGTKPAARRKSAKAATVASSGNESAAEKKKSRES